MEIKAIIFDVDGVIIDSHANKLESINIILKENNLTFQQVEHILNGQLFRVNRKIWFKQIIEEFKLNKTVEELSTKYSKYTLNNLHLVEEILETKQFIQNNFKKYLFFTNTALPRSDISQILKEKQIENYFKEIYCFDTGNKKENIQKIMNKYNLKPYEILFVDDIQKNLDDVKELKIKTLLFDRTKKINYNF